jgi:hypothetical protein
MNFRSLKARSLEVRFNDEHRSSMDRVESLPLLRQWRFPRVSGLALPIAGVLSSWSTRRIRRGLGELEAVIR